MDKKVKASIKVEVDNPNTPERVLATHAATLTLATDYKALTHEDYAHGGTLLKMLTAVEKEYKAKEDTALVPAKAAVDAIRDLFAPGKNKLAACKLHIKNQMGNYEKQVARQAEEQRSRILRDGRTKGETKEAKLQSIVAPPVANTRTVRVLKVTEESKIPREFFELNESALKKWLLEGNTCDGAHLENEKIIVS